MVHPELPEDMEVIITSPDSDCPLCEALLVEKRTTTSKGPIDVIVCPPCGVIFNLKWAWEESYA